MNDFVLECLEKTFIKIKGDYPSEYKKSSFAIGAKDLAMEMMSKAPFEDRIRFASCVDGLYRKHFG